MKLDNHLSLYASGMFKMYTRDWFWLFLEVCDYLCWGAQGTPHLPLVDKLERHAAGHAVESSLAASVQGSRTRFGLHSAFALADMCWCKC